MIGLLILAILSVIMLGISYVPQGREIFSSLSVEENILLPIIVRNKSKFNLDQIWLASSDKDWELLIDTNVSKFSYTTRKETTLNNWSEHHECTPEEYISIKCLQGDTGDNIKGIEGIGPKRALDLVKQYGSAFDIHAAIPISSKYKFITALNNSGDTILTNYKLMDLVTYCEEAIGEENIRNINERLENVIDNKY